MIPNLKGRETNVVEIKSMKLIIISNNGGNLIMGIRGKDGANYDNVDELMKANARWEQQERQNKLLEQQNKEVQRQENQRQEEFKKQMAIEKEKIYEESRKTDAIEAQTRAIEEQNKIALMTDEEKAIYKEEKEKEKFVQTLNKVVDDHIADMEELFDIIEEADQQYLDNISITNNKKQMLLNRYEMTYKKFQDKKKVKIEKVILKALLFMPCIALAIALILCMIDDTSLISVFIPLIIIDIVIMLGSNKAMNLYYTRDYSKKIAELKKEVKTSILPSLQKIPKFKRLSLDNTTDYIQEYKRFVLDYIISLKDTFNQWNDVCSKNIEYMKIIGEDSFNVVKENIEDSISIIKRGL